MDGSAPNLHTGQHSVLAAVGDGGCTLKTEYVGAPRGLE